MSGTNRMLDWVRGRAPLVTRAPDPERAQIHIENIVFNDSTKLDLKRNSIVVFTGANNAGKSTILKEVYRYLSKGQLPRIVTKAISTRIDGHPSDFRKLIEKAGLKSAKPGYLSISGYTDYDIDNLEKDFASHFVGRAPMAFFADYVSASERLHLARPAARVDYRERSPEHPTLWLELDDAPLQKIQKVFQKVFSQTLQLNVLQGSNLGFHVVPTDDVEKVTNFSNSREYYNWINSFPPLEYQGDGMRSFAGALLSLLVHPRNVVMLDEPEAFLHPPQARKLAETIAQETDENSQVFLATHDTDIVRGLLDAASDRVVIVRIARKNDKNKITVMDNEQIHSLWRDPLLRTSSILSSMFNDISVFCEGETDARFMQVLLDSTRIEKADRDCQFYHVGGKAKIAEVVRALKALNVPSIAIVDIDVLNDEAMFKRLFEAFGGNFNEIRDEFKTISKYVSDKRKINYGEFAHRLEELSRKVLQEKDISEDSINKLQNMRRVASIWDQIKQGGRVEFNGDTLGAFDRIYEKAKTLGLIINQEGELEGFCRTINRARKQEWLNKVTELDFKSDSNLSSARSFAAVLRESMENIISDSVER